MCGISGIVSGQAAEKIQRLQAMIKSQHHRGPDDNGHLLMDGCVLGHNRLSIVDLGGGHQPMTDASGGLAIVFNGEIYGYKDLRKKTAFDYRTESDTEVILALYTHYGRECVTRLPGMFAFALWDKRRQTLFAARDRFGEKPLFYAVTKANELVFASELKAILASGLLVPEIDPRSVAHYLSKLYVDPARTIYRNIHVLPPGHAMEFSDGKLTINRYWNFPEPRYDIGLADACAQFGTLLGSAVRSQLIADVPVAAFLSGGLDSSTIVGEAVKHTSDLTTLSYRFAEGLDEGPFARSVADMHRTHHVELNDERVDIAALIRKMPTIYDEPFGDSSCIPTYLICKKAKEFSKVVLTGDGGDELLGGYISRYRPMVIFADHAESSRAMTLLRFVLFGSLRKTLPKGNASLNNVTNGLKSRLRFSDIPTALDSLCSFFGDRELEQSGFGRETLQTDFVLDGSVNDAMKADLRGYMPGDILVKTDRAAMANGLELRAPFLDVQLAEFLISLSGSLKIDDKQDKILLRRTFEETWPQKIRNRSKQGFGAPVNLWLKIPDVAEMKAAVFGPGHAIRDHVPAGLLTRYQDSDCDRTWALFVLGIWLESIQNSTVFH